MPVQAPHFAAFGWLHVAMLAGMAIAAFAWARWARQEPDEARRRHVEQMVAYANLVLFIVIRLYLITPSQFKWSVWPPLGMCDIVSLLASLKLLNPQSRWLSIALYYGGIGLTTNALVTPDLTEGPREFEFWAFWLRHAAIVVVAVYDLAVLRFRANWHDWRRACAMGFFYIAAVSGINVPFGLNFGFMGDSLPGHASVLDFLGAWPLRLVWVVLIVGSLWAFMTLPFIIGNTGRRARRAEAHGDGNTARATE